MNVGVINHNSLEITSNNSKQKREQATSVAAKRFLSKTKKKTKTWKNVGKSKKMKVTNWFLSWFWSYCLTKHSICFIINEQITKKPTKKKIRKPKQHGGVIKYWWCHHQPTNQFHSKSLSRSYCHHTDTLCVIILIWKQICRNCW